MKGAMDLIDRIRAQLGCHGEYEVAERIFNELRADGRICDDGSQGFEVRADVDLQQVAGELMNRVEPYLAVAGRLSPPDTGYIDSVLTYENATVAAASQTFDRELRGQARYAEVLAGAPVTIADVFVSTAPIIVAEQYHGSEFDYDEKQGGAVRASVDLQHPVPDPANRVQPYLAVAGRFSVPDTDYIDRALTYEGMTVAEAKQAFKHDLWEWASESDLPEKAPITIAYVLVSGAPLVVAEAHV